MTPISNKGSWLWLLLIGYYFRGRIKETRHGMIGHHEGKNFPVTHIEK